MGKDMTSPGASPAGVSAPAKKLRIAFCHPDLGIGGAERLIVDAAAELTAQGHSVTIFTAHHDPKRCFEETRDGTFPVKVYGDWLPRHIFQRMHALCAYLRCLYVALMMALWWGRFDVIIADQVSAVIPLLRLKRKSKILFYCHFPDMLLAQRKTWLRRLYRGPIDWVEELTTGMADVILVNSAFTAAVFQRTFTRLTRRGIQPAVLHPAVNIDDFDKRSIAADADGVIVNGGLEGIEGLQPHSRVLLSINRFERKKNVGLAIAAYSLLRKRLEKHLVEAGSSSDQQANGKHHSSNGTQSSGVGELKLIIAGGYDVRLLENREVLAELKAQAVAAGLRDSILFVPSFTQAQKQAILAACIAVVYTPQDEHFGIVPLEAMAARRPVLACNSGGPTESIEHTVTGFLCEPKPEAFAAAMERLVREPGLAQRMGDNARAHVEANFSRKVFGERLESILWDMLVTEPIRKRKKKAIKELRKLA